jgi:Tfp pilus assembly protein PilX
MSYSIALRVYQTNPNAYFNAVEKTVWGYANGGTWTEATGGEFVLTMGGSGTCGTLRFQADTGEKIVVAVGVHNYERWCDIVQDVKSDQTGATIQAQYYNGGGRDSQREKQLSSYSVTSASGRKVSIEFTVSSGQALKANITIQ